MPDKRYKGRCIQIIARSLHQKAKLEELAEKAGSPLSKFLLNLIEEALVDKPRSMEEPWKDHGEEINQLKEDLKVKSMLLERYEKELVKIQADQFLQVHFKGSRKINPQLIDLIKQGPQRDLDILDALKIDPNDSDMVESISRQLEVLESYGLVKRGFRGWQWIS
jgi:hypothetical protein